MTLLEDVNSALRHQRWIPYVRKLFIMLFFLYIMFFEFVFRTRYTIYQMVGAIGACFIFSIIISYAESLRKKAVVAKIEDIIKVFNLRSKLFLINILC